MYQNPEGFGGKLSNVSTATVVVVAMSTVTEGVLFAPGC
jgi:hypothetical protein